MIKPNKPFQDWLVSIDPEDKHTNFDKDVYLLPDFEESKQMENWLRKNFDQIFCDQMNHWYKDESVWVANRTFKMFKEWFDYLIHTMIWDTVNTPIKKA